MTSIGPKKNKRIIPQDNSFMRIPDLIKTKVPEGLKNLYGFDISPNALIINLTRKEFEGDYTVVTFPFAKQARKSPGDVAEALGEYLIANTEEFVSYNVIKGFLNLSVGTSYWPDFLKRVLENDSFGYHDDNGRKALVEFSSPNTNKPLHLGHIRNILLGWSTSKILKAAGYDVVKTQIINDRGIAICKSMLAWQEFGAGATPESTGTKSDHFVGHWYVQFEKHFKAEYGEWQGSDAAKKVLAEKDVKEENVESFWSKYKNEYFNTHSGLGAKAKQMLLDWEAGKEETRNLWKKMNQWVYDGFEVTYKNLGVEFDSLYYESNTYLLGKDIIEDGLSKDIFYKKDDNSVWIDLEKDKLDHKLVLRSDGTSVYMTQDIGTARKRYEDTGADTMIYVVADEQNHHFKVLFKILERMGEPYAKSCHHLSYGMVNLPHGRMKSREGTVVDADDLMADVIGVATKNSEEVGTVLDLPKEDQEKIFEQIGLAALKFFIIKVNPKKSMIFNPEESVDMQGQTGPYVQNAGVRCRGILRKLGEYDGNEALKLETVHDAEKETLRLIHSYPEIIADAAKDLDPSHVANYCYSLAKSYHKFFNSGLSVIRAESEAAKAFRGDLTQATLQILESGMDLLGIEIPERM